MTIAIWLEQLGKALFAMQRPRLGQTQIVPK